MWAHERVCGWGGGSLYRSFLDSRHAFIRRLIRSLRLFSAGGRLGDVVYPPPYGKKADGFRTATGSTRAQRCSLTPRPPQPGGDQRMISRVTKQTRGPFSSSQFSNPRQDLCAWRRMRRLRRRPAGGAKGKKIPRPFSLSWLAGSIPPSRLESESGSAPPPSPVALKQEHMAFGTGTAEGRRLGLPLVVKPPAWFSHIPAGQRERGRNVPVSGRAVCCCLKSP